MQKRFLGFGLGLRTPHYEDVLSQRPAVDWFEVMTEDYLTLGGRNWHYLQQIRQNYPVAMHGVSMSLASTDPLNYEYLQQVKALIRAIEPEWISDHLCWTGVAGLNLHDLLPVPYHRGTLQHLAERILQVQDYLGQRILVENVSSYIEFKDSEMSEWEFLKELCTKADCLLLLDINNIYVNSYNFKFSAQDFLRAIPAERVQQFHLAGHTNKGNIIIDTHDAAIIDPVWKLYAEAVELFGPVSVIIERDDHIPPLPELLTELHQAVRIHRDVWASVEEVL